LEHTELARKRGKNLNLQTILEILKFNIFIDICCWNSTRLRFYLWHFSFFTLISPLVTPWWTTYA